MEEPEIKRNCGYIYLKFREDRTKLTVYVNIYTRMLPKHLKRRQCRGHSVGLCFWSVGINKVELGGVALSRFSSDLFPAESAKRSSVLHEPLLVKQQRPFRAKKLFVSYLLKLKPEMILHTSIVPLIMFAGRPTETGSTNIPQRG